MLKSAAGLPTFTQGPQSMFGEQAGSAKGAYGTTNTNAFSQTNWQQKAAEVTESFPDITQEIIIVSIFPCIMLEIKTEITGMFSNVF